MQESTSHFLVGLMGPLRLYTGSPGAPRRPGLPAATLHCLFWGISYRRAPLTEITWNKQKRFLLQGVRPPTTRVPNRGRRPGTGRPGTGEASWRPPAPCHPAHHRRLGHEDGRVAMSRMTRKGYCSLINAQKFASSEMAIAISVGARKRRSTKPSRTPFRRPIRFQSSSRRRAGAPGERCVCLLKTSSR